jgi:hypothetical protein
LDFQTLPPNNPVAVVVVVKPTVLIHKVEINTEMINPSGVALLSRMDCTKGKIDFTGE